MNNSKGLGLEDVSRWGSCDRNKMEVIEAGRFESDRSSVVKVGTGRGRGP